LSEESFIKDNLDFFQNLKLRGGWGVTGSDAVGAYSSYSPLTRPIDGGYSYGIGRVFPAYEEGVGGNSNLQWEETKQTNVGLDATLLTGKLSVSLDFYIKHTDKLLNNLTIPLYNAGGTIPVNLGRVDNKGFEANINYMVIDRKDFAWDMNLNGAINRNKVIDIGQEQDKLYGDIYADGVLTSSPFIIMPGLPLGTLYGFKSLGIWQQEDAAEAAKFGLKPGDYRYDDLNGNNQYDVGDYQVIGNSNPKFTWGFNNHFSYRNFDLNVLFEGVHDRDVLNMAYCFVSERISDSQSVTLHEARNRWTIDNPNAPFSRAGAATTKPNSSRWVQNASYVKLRNLGLSYQFTKQTTKFADIKLSVNAQNMLTLTKYKGYDPEISSAGGNRVDTDAGVDWFGMPTSKRIIFGLTLEY
jgi:outer membrane receptor protein involved in Fe transport